jgi:hypothetical protein
MTYVKKNIFFVCLCFVFCVFCVFCVLCVVCVCVFFYM